MASYYLEGTVTHFNSAKGFGFVKCRDGREFFSWFRVVENKRLPRLGDKIDFLPSFKDAKPGKAPEITRLRYSKPSPEETSHKERKLDDGKERCPHCGRRVVPRVVTWQGRPEASYCSLCGGLIKRFMIVDNSDAGFSGSLIGMFVAAALTALLVVFIAN